MSPDTAQPSADSPGRRPARVFRRPIAINEAFRPQRITGQQRYAIEIADRLDAQYGAEPVRPKGRFASSGKGTWAWVLGILPVITSQKVLLSLTARTPLFHPRHVVVVHDLFVITNPEWYSKAYIASHVPLLKAALKTAKAVACVSEPVARQLAESRLTSAPITVAPNAPSPLFMAASDGQAAAGSAGGILDRLDLESDRFLLVVGSLDPRKNLARLAEAYAGLGEAQRAECPLVVVGGGASVFSEVGVTWPPGTVMAGYVSDSELASLYRSARGVVFPSLAEGFGLPLVEAAVSGARLAVSDIEVFQWIGGDAVKYFDPLSAEAIRESMAELIAERGVQADESFARDIRSRFDWDTSARTIMEACRRVAKR